jgi:hypothetical protein
MQDSMICPCGLLYQQQEEDGNGEYQEREQETAERHDLATMVVRRRTTHFNN